MPMGISCVQEDSKQLTKMHIIYIVDFVLEVEDISGAWNQYLQSEDKRTSWSSQTERCWNKCKFCCNLPYSKIWNMQPHYTL